MTDRALSEYRTHTSQISAFTDKLKATNLTFLLDHKEDVVAMIFSAVRQGMH